MSVAVVVRTWRDSWRLVVFLSLAIVAFELLLVRALGEMPAEAAAWLDRPFFKPFLRMLLGADLAESFSATGLLTLGFAHPFLFAVTWAAPLTICTRVTVGEIDRGTADLLLTLPLSRASIYISASVVWAGAGLALSAAPLLGVWLGLRLFPLWEPVDLVRLRVLIVNLLALYMSIGGTTMLVGSIVSRRGSAIAIVLTALLASFLLNYLATMWPAVEWLAMLGPLHYYKPLQCIRPDHSLLPDVTVLATVALLAYLGGLWRFCHRDVPAA